MIFRQLIDYPSNTYTYIIASGPGREGLIIDPVLEHVDQYIALLNELDLKLVLTLDTHTHADHITATGALRNAIGCKIAMGEKTQADCVDIRLKDNEIIDIDGTKLTALYTPGHTNEHFCYRMNDRIFTGDLLLIHATGRTDFQSGDPYASYDSLFNRVLTLDEATFVYPAHDYNGMTVSTIGQEKAFNPRLQVSNAEEYAEIMNNLNLPRPKLMDVAVPANLRCGLV